MKKLLPALLLGAALTLFTGCGSVFDTEYVSVSDYVPAVQDDAAGDGRVTVRSLAELKQAIHALVAAGETEGSVFFDADYQGEVAEDMAGACWQVRSQDALCAYCVEDIAYELNKIVAYYEAKISISYSAALGSAGEIVQMEYSAGMEEAVKAAFQAGDTKLVVLIEHSAYSAENMESMISRIYRKFPVSAPEEPKISVNMFSGTGLQRLYEINISYGMTAAELRLRQERMAELQPFQDLELQTMTAAEKALAACGYLAENCVYTEEADYKGIYSALVQGQANSEGMALAMVELCARLGIDCQIVYGQKNWQDYCWNIAEIEGVYYHIDPGACAAEGLEKGFLLDDEHMWAEHRWDVSAYPVCQGPLSYEDLSSGEQ